MKKLKLKTVKNSPNLIKANSNQPLTSQFPKEKILEIIDNAKRFEKGISIDSLKGIVVNYIKKGYKTKPGEFSELISSTGETAYQRAIFLSKKTKLNTIGEVSWKDLELPVVFNKSSRRRCVDLIGTLGNTVSVLCELKFASPKSNSNSPIYAAIELLIYYHLIKDNCEALDTGNVFHENMKSFEWKNFNHKSIFIVGANEKYWNYWQNRYEKQKNEVEAWLRSIPLTIQFFSSANFDFKEQKRIQKNKTYQPSISDKIEWTEVSFPAVSPASGTLRIHYSKTF